MLAIILALAAALAFALGTVLQARVAAQATEEEARGAGFLLQLARRPMWLGGIVADGLGFALQFAALTVGRLAVVQPVIATSVVFALPLGRWIGGAHITRRQVYAAIAVTVGLIVFLVLGDASGGVEEPSTRGWIVSIASICGVSGVLVLFARGRPPALRAALLGSATGLLFALSALLTVVVGNRFEDGFFTIFTGWPLYALLVVGYLSMTLSQASLQTGALAPAIATQMTLDPLVSIALGIAVLHEELHEDALGIVVSALAIAVMLAGIVVLASAEQESEPPAPTRPVPAPA